MQHSRAMFCYMRESPIPQARLYIMDMQGKVLTKDIKKSQSINKNMNHKKQASAVYSTQTSVWL